MLKKVIVLPHSGPRETPVTWLHLFAGVDSFETTEVLRGGFHTLVRIDPAARFLRVPADYEITVTAKNAATGAVLWKKSINELLRVNCTVPRGIRVKFEIEYPASAYVRAPLFPLKKVWNPRVTLSVCDGTSGYVADWTL